MKTKQHDANITVQEHDPKRQLSLESSPPRQVGPEQSAPGAPKNQRDQGRTGKPDSPAEDDAPSEIRLLVMEVRSGECWIQITSGSGATFRVPAEPETADENEAPPPTSNAAVSAVDLASSCPSMKEYTLT